MSDSYLDHLPGREREKIRKRMRSPEEYERLREKVKGPEDLECEMEKNAEFAEVRLALESEPGLQEKSKEAVKSFVGEQGIEKAFTNPDIHLQDALKNGNFEMTVDSQKGEPKLAVKIQGSVDAPSGNVQEVFTLSPVLQQQIVSSFSLKGKDE